MQKLFFSFANLKTIKEFVFSFSFANLKTKKGKDCIYTDRVDTIPIIILFISISLYIHFKFWPSEINKIAYFQPFGSTYTFYCDIRKPLEVISVHGGAQRTWFGCRLVAPSIEARPHESLGYRLTMRRKTYLCLVCLIQSYTNDRMVATTTNHICCEDLRDHSSNLCSCTGHIWPSKTGYWGRLYIGWTLTEVNPLGCRRSCQSDAPSQIPFDVPARCATTTAKGM